MDVIVAVLAGPQDLAPTKDYELIVRDLLRSAD